jgi:hypothetical protein
LFTGFSLVCEDAEMLNFVNCAVLIINYSGLMTET